MAIRREENIGGARLILGDCETAMAEMTENQFELAIVDPPYGGDDAIGVQNGNGHSAARKDYKLFDNTEPDPHYFDELLRVSGKQIVWGANFYKKTNLSGGMICWNKFGTAFGEAELAWYSHSKSVKVFEYAWNGMIQGNMKTKETRIHPTQKPVNLYTWLLKNYAKEGDHILDTHGGSMSSVIACLNMGHKITCYEIDEDYFDAGCRRVEDAQKQLRLF